MTDKKDPYDNPLNNFFNNPLVVALLMCVAILAVALGMMDGMYAIIILGLGAFMIYRSTQKRKNNP
jgi:membrane-bound ClpP family serine protease